jgi:hypothetical protein
MTIEGHTDHPDQQRERQLLEKAFNDWRKEYCDI